MGRMVGNGVGVGLESVDVGRMVGVGVGLENVGVGRMVGVGNGVGVEGV